jgi:hypothetical protein
MKKEYAAISLPQRLLPDVCEIDSNDITVLARLAVKSSSPTNSVKVPARKTEKRARMVKVSSMKRMEEVLKLSRLLSIL